MFGKFTLVALFVAVAADARRLLGYKFPTGECNARRIAELDGSGYDLLLRPAVTCGNLAGLGGVTVENCNVIDQLASVPLGNTFAAYNQYPLPSNISFEVWFSVNAIFPPGVASLFTFWEVSKQSVFTDLPRPMSTLPDDIQLRSTLSLIPGGGMLGDDDLVVLNTDVSALIYPGGACDFDTVNSLFLVESTPNFTPTIQRIMNNTGVLFKVVVNSGKVGYADIFISAGGAQVQYATAYQRIAFLTDAFVMRTVFYPDSQLRLGCTAGETYGAPRSNIMLHKVAIYDQQLSLAEVVAAFAQ